LVSDYHQYNCVAVVFIDLGRNGGRHWRQILCSVMHNRNRIIGHAWVVDAHKTVSSEEDNGSFCREPTCARTPDRW